MKEILFKPCLHVRRKHKQAQKDKNLAQSRGWAAFWSEI